MGQQGILTDSTSAAADIETVTGDSGGAVGPNAAFNLSMLGSPDLSFAGTPATNSFVVTDLVKWTPYVVDAVAGSAPYSTIQAAITAAETTGNDEVVLVRRGIYTEDLTFSTGVTLQIIGAVGEEDVGDIEIIGQHTPSATGSLSFRNFNLSSATNIFNSVAAGSGGITVVECTLNVTNGYTFNLANWTGRLSFNDCDSSGTNDGIVNNTAAAPLFFNNCQIGAGTVNTMTTNSSNARYDLTYLDAPVAITNGVHTGFLTIYGKTVTISGTATLTSFLGDFLDTGSINLTTTSLNTVVLNQCTLDTSAVNSITGTGSVELNGVNFADSTGIASSVTKVDAGTFEAANLFVEEFSLDRGTNHLQTSGTGQTIGAVTADVYTLNLGTTASSYFFTVSIAGFASATSLSAGYRLRGVFETDGAAASISGSGSSDEEEEAAAVAASAQLVASGNSAIVRVTGVAGSTFNWRAIIEWVRTE